VSKTPEYRYITRDPIKEMAEIEMHGVRVRIYQRRMSINGWSGVQAYTDTGELCSAHKWSAIIRKINKALRPSNPTHPNPEGA